MWRGKESLCGSGGKVSWHSLHEGSEENWKTELRDDPATPLLQQPNQHSTDRLGHHGSVALFTTARKCNQPGYPRTDEPGKEPNVYTGQFYLAIKKSQYLQEMERKGNHHDTQHKPGSGKPHFGSFGLCVGMDVYVWGGGY